MLIKYDDIKKSAVWDPVYNLPLVPEHNNCFIYCAYIKLLMQKANIDFISVASIAEYYRKCMIEPGLINRHPDGSGGKTSHDELMGAAFLSPLIAQDIVKFIKKNNGYYNNLTTKKSFKDNLYRFPWIMPYLKACAGITPSWCEQRMWSLFCWIDSRQTTTDVGGKLRFWLMGEVMKKFPSCSKAITKRDIKLKSKGIDLYAMFKAEIDYNELTELAKTIG